MRIRAPMCPFVYLHPTFHPAGGVQVLQKAWDLLSDGVKAIFRTAESNLGALNTVDLGPRRLASVGERALWARLTGHSFAAQVAAVVGLVVAPANHYTQKDLRGARRRETPKAQAKGHQGGGGRGGSDSHLSHSRGRLRGGEAPGC
jgi:hypothetical protein